MCAEEKLEKNSAFNTGRPALRRTGRQRGLSTVSLPLSVQLSLGINTGSHMNIFAGSLI
jgi:hypothetical protein